MTPDLLGALISGLVSGAASGALAGHYYVKRSVTTRADSHGQATTGRSNQTNTSSGPGQMATTRKGSISQNITAGSERPAELLATVVQRTVTHRTGQVLVLKNLGDLPADNLRLGPVPGAGGFKGEPDWSAFPSRLLGGQEVELPCLTMGVGIVQFVVQFDSNGSGSSSIICEATHRP